MRISGWSFLIRGVAAVVVVGFGLAVGATAQTFTTLATFDFTNGAGPSSPPIQATDGNFYGTTTGGGSDEWGVVYRMTPDGELTSIYSFCSQPNCADGIDPDSQLVLGIDGNLYGTTYAGGSANYGGTVFKITLDGELTTLYTFCPQLPCSDGGYPNGVIQASNGELYGTTQSGGSSGHGVFFHLTQSGKLSVLHSFCPEAPNCGEGGSPLTPPIQGIDGNFYGATYWGGSSNVGAIYKITLAGAY
jgi:uncharacterized repeat protein (TIGR03803 family)